jgi:hypothetical protein
MAGLYLCCREVHQELEADFIARFRPLLIAKYGWETIGFRDTPIRMMVKLRVSRHMLKPELSIVSPITILQPDDEVESNASLPTLDFILQSVFSSTWSVLTLSARDHDFPVTRRATFFQCVSHALGQEKNSTFQDFRHIDRLVLNYGIPHDSVTTKIFDNLSWSFHYTRNHFSNLSQARPVVQAWISRSFEGEEAGRRVALDFKSEMSPVEGGLWRLGDSKGKITVDRLFYVR